MIYLQIDDLHLKNYIINQRIEDNQVIGIFSKDKNITKTFLDIISGINISKNNCFHLENNIYDNKQYFNQRLYIDFSKRYLSTLKVNYIEERLKNKYNLSFNKEKFVKITKDLDVRGETEITYVYNFSKAGNTFVNYALVSSLDKQNIIVNNPTCNLNISEDVNYIVKGLTNKQIYNTVILGIDNLSLFNGYLDKVLLFTDFNQVIMFNGNDTLIVFDEEYFDIKNKLFQGSYIIAINDYTRDELKDFVKQKINYKVISVCEIEKFL